MSSYVLRVFRSLAPLKKKLVIKANEEISVMCPLIRWYFIEKNDWGGANEKNFETSDW